MNGKRIHVVFLTVFLSFGLLFPADHASADFSGHDRLQMVRSAEAAANRMREEEAIAHLTTEPARVMAGSPTVVRFSLTDAAGKPLQGLTLMHERYVHVVIISQDFSVFAHIHPRDFERLTPQVLKRGQFFVRFTFPKAGRYVVGLDFAVKGRPFGRHFVIDVVGKPVMTAPEKDFTRTEKADGLDVSFATTPEPLRAKYNAMLSYIFTKDGNPVTDLQPWLGAPMHLAIVSSDLKYFLHVHGEVPGMTAHMHGEGHMHMHVPPKFGPKIEVPVVFPAKGLYKVFGQVGHKGKVILTNFMVEVE